MQLKTTFKYSCDEIFSMSLNKSLVSFDTAASRVEQDAIPVA